ncbi:MAG: CRISPR-associated endoribonuclease Cas6 [Firmicutes bacterium HGW-Firmicutes-12]|jgi:CRISPR-associated endoribonuclease Cas6|nr:MAG: CRISPR-associated endoribonuclease Cas6 [Firmicutes bacterium HGW-Firmicutes-12]
MRIKAEFETASAELPIDYRRKLLSYLKCAFEDYDKELFLALYGGGHAPKSFCFSTYFGPKVIISSNGITLDSKRFTMWFTTPDVLMGVHLVNALMTRRNKWYPIADCQNKLKLLSITKVQEHTITSNVVPFKILSPIVIRDHDEREGKDWYLTHEDDRFEEIWKRNLKTELKSAFGRDVISDIEALQMRPIHLKKTVVLNYDIYIPCTIGSLVLEGDRYLLEYFYKAGVGSRRSLGFGCLNVF